MPDMHNGKPRVLSGHCFCGGVRFRTSGFVRTSGHCHCESCRRATSSPVTTFFTVPREGTDLAGESLRYYASSPGVRRGFCGNCGSPMSFETERRPDDIDLYVASLDEGLSVPIREHWHWDERVDWLHVADDLPKSKGGV
ncbi:GFA family protein [Rhizobium rhizophilum]|uniref:GFA family protein n=1 Tax=Rhizobium rhizophilum TaxID=1850373 RepID=A0ABY2QTM3_9HYPH|nr:GFA family protein [Rhizobium rhizophilum]THV13622.1 GFA family protein [Rhizobium rhizophilum]